MVLPVQTLTQVKMGGALLPSEHWGGGRGDLLLLLLMVVLMVVSVVMVEVVVALSVLGYKGPVVVVVGSWVCEGMSVFPT